MNWQTLDVRRDPRGVVHVALNTPDRRNVLSAAMIAELTRLARSIAEPVSYTHLTLPTNREV